MHMLHKNYSLCVNITPAYDRISKIRARHPLRNQLKFHICEAQSDSQLVCCEERLCGVEVCYSVSVKRGVSK